MLFEEKSNGFRNIGSLNSIKYAIIQAILPENEALKSVYRLSVSYRFDEDTDIDLSAGYLRSKDNIPANTSSLSNKTGVDNLLLNPYAGLNVKTKTDVIILGINYRTRW